MKILLITPNLKSKGGVSVFNHLLIKYSKNNIRPFVISSVNRNTFKVFFLLKDFLKLFFVLMFNKYDLVHINPSLNRNSVMRDSIYVAFAKLFRHRVYIHWHGWNYDKEYLLESFFMRNLLFKADHIRFLADDFKNKFINAGYNNGVSLGNTFVDDEILVDYKKTDSKDLSKKCNILFLTTIATTKGIFIAIDAFKIIQAKFNHVTFYVAGSGKDLNKAQEYVKVNNISNVIFLGHVEGEEKVKAFSTADIYIFPSYFEGMPTSLLEAMAFGLPIVTSDVGGIKDFFEDGVMGFITNKKTYGVYAMSIEQLILNKTLYQNISNFNCKYAKERFLASNTVKSIENEYRITSAK